MSGELEFPFEELPLIVDLGFEAGLVNGAATIGYEDDGEWFVRALSLDGHRRIPAAEKTAIEAKLGTVIKPYQEKPVEIDRASFGWLFGAIVDQFENGRFKIHVEDAVQKALEGDREDGTAPSQRDDREEHSTLNHAQHGV